MRQSLSKSQGSGGTGGSPSVSEEQQVAAMFNEINFVLEQRLILKSGPVSYDADGFSMDVVFDEVKYTLDIRRLGSLKYQYSVSGTGCSERGTFSLKSEWILGVSGAAETVLGLSAFRGRCHNVA